MYLHGKSLSCCWGTRFRILGNRRKSSTEHLLVWISLEDQQVLKIVLTVGSFAGARVDNEIVAVTGRSVVLAILFRRATAAASNPYVDLVIRAAATGVLHYQIFLEIRVIKDFAWLMEGGTRSRRTRKWIVVRSGASCIDTIYHQGMPASQSLRVSHNSPALSPRPSQLYAVVEVPQSLELTQLSGSVAQI